MDSVPASFREWSVFVFLGKTLNSHRASLNPGVSMGTSKFIAGATLGLTRIPPNKE